MLCQCRAIKCTHQGRQCLRDAVHELEQSAPMIAGGGTHQIGLCDHCKPFYREVQFVGIGCSVMRGSENVCTARSNTMAQRIANALNVYQPNERGV